MIGKSGALLRLGVLASAAGLTLAACGSSTSKTASTAASGGSSTTAASGGASPGTMFTTASVSGLGTVVVDGSGKTVYVLTKDGKTNTTCDDASGCTKVWPDLPLPAGVTSATAGSGVKASLLGTKKEADGQLYPTYNGWLMYEYSGDTGPAMGGGEGINSFGGTWYALSASGTLIVPGGSTTATTRYGY